MEQQDSKIQKQNKTIAKQQEQIDALKALIQKVSDKVEMNKPAT